MALRRLVLRWKCKLGVSLWCILILWIHQYEYWIMRLLIVYKMAEICLCVTKFTHSPAIWTESVQSNWVFNHWQPKYGIFEVYALCPRPVQSRCPTAMVGTFLNVTNDFWMQFSPNSNRGFSWETHKNEKKIQTGFLRGLRSSNGL